MRAARDAGPTLERSRTVTPSRSGASAIVVRSGLRAIGRSEVLRQPELPSRDDVLLHFGGAASDRVEHRVAVGRFGAAVHRRVLGLDAELRAGTADVHR